VKKTYVAPKLNVYGDVRTITQKPGKGKGNAYGLSCGNGNVFGPSSCGNGVPARDDHGRGRGKR
jgi:hypothetical protein